MKKDYEDIIGLEYRKSTKRPHMPLADRAAQFSPFAALKGYDDTIDEAGRWVDERRELDEETVLRLNAVLAQIKERKDAMPLVRATYFRADEKKEGGFYFTATDRVRKIAERERKLVLFDTGAIPFADLAEIEIIEE